MPDTHEILEGIKELNQRLDLMAKLNDRVIILEQSDKQAWRDIKSLKEEKANDREFQELKRVILGTNVWWKDLLKGVLAVAIASLIIGFIMNKSQGGNNAKISNTPND